ncbi:MAG: DUF1476 domain-containing protein [Alphaproteobacteria bacterium]
MTGLDDRKDAFEAKYAHEEQMDFAVEARACKLFGLIIAEKIGLNGEEAQSYAMDVVEANLEEAGFEDVFRKVRPDLDGKGVEYTDHELNTLMDQAVSEAKTQLAGE